MSTDGGSVWTEIDSYFTDGGDIAGHPSDPDTWWTGGRKSISGFYGISVSRTTDGGSSWERYDIGTAYGMLYALAVNPLDGDVVYAAGYQDGDPAVFRTPDGGGTWRLAGMAGLSGYVYALEVCPADTGRLVAGTSSGIYTSDDSGESWTQASGSPGRTEALAVDPDDGMTLYAGVYSGGVYMSQDGGSSWTDMGGGFPEAGVAAMVMDGSRWLLAGTSGEAVWRRQLTVGNAPGSAAPAALRGMSLSPNPASGTVLVSFEAASACEAELRLYDLTGRMVGSTSHPVGAGDVTLTLSPGAGEAGLPAGVYAVVVEMPGEVLRGRLVLTR